MKTKDIVVFSIIGLIGVIGIWFVFSKMTAKNESGGQPASEQTGVQSNFSKLNTEVTKKEQVMNDSKTELVKEEIRQEEQLREQRERDVVNAKNPHLNKSKVSDISSYIEAGKAEVNDLTEAKPIEVPVREKQDQRTQKMKPGVNKINTSSIQQQPKKVSENVVIEKVASKKSSKRKRNKRMDDSVSLETNVSKQVEVAVVEESVSAEGTYSANATVYGKYQADAGKRITVMLTENLTTPWGVMGEGSLVDGTCEFGKARLKVNIVSIRVNGKVHPVNGKLVDAFDGMDGLPVAELSDNQQVGRTVTQNGATQVAAKLGIPFVGPAVSALAQKKQQTKEVPLGGDERVIVVIQQ